MAIINWKDPEARRAYGRDRAKIRYYSDETYRKALCEKYAARLNQQLATLKSQASAGDIVAQAALAAHREKDKLRKRTQRAAQRASQA